MSERKSAIVNDLGGDYIEETRPMANYHDGLNSGEQRPQEHHPGPVSSDDEDHSEEDLPDEDQFDKMHFREDEPEEQSDEDQFDENELEGGSPEGNDSNHINSDCSIEKEEDQEDFEEDSAEKVISGCK